MASIFDVKTTAQPAPSSLSQLISQKQAANVPRTSMPAAPKPNASLYPTATPTAPPSMTSSILSSSVQPTKPPAFPNVPLRPGESPGFQSLAGVPQIAAPPPKPATGSVFGSAAPGGTAPGSVGPRAVDSYTPGAMMQTNAAMAQPSLQATQQLGANLQGQGAQVANQQSQQAANFNAAGQGFNATSQNVSGNGFNVGQRQPMGGGTAAPRALSPSQLGATPQAAAVGNVAGQLGGGPQVGQVGNIAGQLGGAPGAVNPGSLGAISNVANGLGGGYQVGNVGGISSRLGGAPQVGDVGNIQMGSGPGSVMPQLGNMGQTNGDQAGMMSRLNGFLDSPDGPSVAEAQLKQAQAGNMADLIGAARSGRGGAGASAQALRGAMSEGSAIMSDTAGQLATLRAQEADMLKNRQLSAIGLGGDMATAARGQDLSFRGQDLSALQGDQSTQLGARGQDLQGAMANQSTQTALEQLRANTALGARGQDLSALQGDQSTALGLEGLRANTSVAQRGQDLSALTADQQASVAARGQNLSALQGNQATSLGARGQDLGALTADQGTQAQLALGQLQASLGARGQDLSALQGDQATAAQMGLGNLQASLSGRGQDLSLLQGNQATALGSRGQDVQRELGLANVNMGLRGQDAAVLTGDADRDLASQRLGLDAGLGYGGLANQANQIGLNHLSQANQQGILAQGMSNDMVSGLLNNQTSIHNQDLAGRYGVKAADAGTPEQMGFWEQMALNTVGGASQGLGTAAGAAALSDERAKTDISSLDAISEHLRGAPGYRYRYKDGFGEDPGVEHAGPMAQDLERGPFGKALVKKGTDGLRRVDTSRLSLVNHAALASMRSELDALKAKLEG
jgi:hypothetical protein